MTTDHASIERVAIITAGSGGIGAACARRLAADGYRLVLLSRGEGCETLANELGGVATRGSVTDPAALERCVDLAVERFGRVDVVVNNTGHAAKGGLLDVTDEQWTEGFDLLTLAVARMARLVTPRMIDQGGGALVNISSYAAVEPDPRYPVSSVMRAALAAYARLFAETHAASGVRMNNVLPGFIDNHPTDPAIVADIPTGRYGHVEEVAAAVSYLASDDARYVTGQNLRVDGGLTRAIP